GKGECVGLVGGSGSGKTTTGRCVTGLHGNATGSLLFGGHSMPFAVSSRSKADLCAMQIVFQNPDRSLNPKESISQSIGRAVRLTGMTDKARVGAEVRSLLDRVRLPQRVIDLYPADLSGGERQRVAVARALALKPKLLVCDEITSALDVSVQAAVVELLLDLKKDGLAMLFITHNLPLVS
ncbi:ATP-binding cassette domain-containing protein, partial [Mesorhizobium sp. M2D.F.Ca.ET.145.01.1.1]